MPYMHIMTSESMERFIASEKEKGASDNMLRRFSCTVRALYEYLPENKTLTKEVLLNWRHSLSENGYASMTVLNYVKYLNRYLDFVGASEIRFNRGKSKDISGMTFGYLTALEPTGAKNRNDIVWRCICKCGKTAELPATRLLLGNTLSCGCLHKEQFQRANKYIDHTSLRQALEEQVTSPRAVSGYTGVTPKRGKWQAYIKYKGRHYALGCYTDIKDAVAARARAKELVQADAMGLLDFYEEIHKSDPALPCRATEPKKIFSSPEWQTNNQPGTCAKRTDNKSGYTGVSRVRSRWEARICHRGIRYILGSFVTQEEAVDARKRAEWDLKTAPDSFAAKYQKLYRHHSYGNKSEQ